MIKVANIELSGDAIKDLPPDKVNDILWAVSKMIRFAKEEFIGNVQFNFYKGGITNANNSYSDKPEHRT